MEIIIAIIVICVILFVVFNSNGQTYTIDDRSVLRNKIKVYAKTEIEKRNLSGSEIISTYVYKVGMVNFQYSYSTAIGLFNTVVNIVILFLVNWLSRKTTKTGLF